MLATIGRCALAFIALVLLGGPAKSAVKYEFFQTGATWSDLVGGHEAMPVGYRASGYIVLSDAAYLNGFAWNFNQGSTTQNWATFGLVDLHFEVNTNLHASITANLSDLVHFPFPFNQGYWLLNLSSAPFGDPTGIFMFNNTISDFIVSFQGATSNIEYRSDALVARCSGKDCNFSGAIATAVPEPSTLAVLLLPLLGMLAKRRRA